MIAMLVCLAIVMVAAVAIWFLLEDKVLGKRLSESTKVIPNEVFSVENIAKATLSSREAVRLKKEKERLEQLAKLKAEEERFISYNVQQTISSIEDRITNAAKNHSDLEIDISYLDFFAKRDQYDQFYQHLYPKFFNLIMSHFSNLGFEIFFDYKKIPGDNKLREKFIPDLSLELSRDKFATIKYIFISWEQKVSDLEVKSQDLSTYRGQDIWQLETVEFYK